MTQRNRAVRGLAALLVLVLVLAVGAVHYGRLWLDMTSYNRALASGDADAIAWDAAPELLMVKAHHLAEAGRIDEAIAGYRLLEQQVDDEQLAAVLYNLGTTHFQLARQLYDQPRTNVAPVIQQARIAFMRALRADSDFYAAKYNLDYLGLPRAETPGQTEGAVDDVADPEAGGTHRWQLLQEFPEGMP
ncbi:hypothetical protein M0534_09715 [Methylonatrum kenyense]|uniref:hypothetical protein n=1 Tax=Methylonatrum kenyense TaxID=455253 RepID=UPI0020BF61F2|nr:hypothetical protein [Methylonatrum kenyense]MCK8516598.1 hypothetical protein [Methylonatrum kenyense]